MKNNEEIKIDGIVCAVESASGYTFKNKKLLVRALTHSSASHTENYEQLEFLGDSVIQLAVSKWLYDRGGSEGEMTAQRQKLVSHIPLKCASEALGLTEHIIKGVRDVSEKALSSVYEAVAGAIFADGGFKAAEKFVKKTLLSAHLKAPINYKGALQEYVQAQGRPLPEYNTRRSGGTPNAPEFVCDVLVCGRSFTGTGGSKGEAEKSAAKSALDSLHGD